MTTDNKKNWWEAWTQGIGEKVKEKQAIVRAQKRPLGLSPFAAGALTKAGVTTFPKGVTTTAPTDPWMAMATQIRDYLAATKVTEAAKATQLTGAQIPAPAGWEDYWDDSGYLIRWDTATGEPYRAKFDPTRVYQPPRPPEKPIIKTRSPYDNPETSEEEGIYDPNTGKWSPPYGYVSPQDQWARDEAARQREEERYWRQQEAAARKEEQLANLRANPASWLEYASLAGTTPGVQPWMLPLMPQQYQGLQAGAALPGWQGQGQSLAGLPQLTSPSRQYQARAGPTAMAQYGGYEKGRTGMTEQELAFRLWSTAPPSGAPTRLSWQR